MSYLGVSLDEILANFIGESPVAKLKDVLSYGVSGDCVLVAWLESIFEGVDMWYVNDELRYQPRFQLKMKFRHDDNVALFTISDDEVENIAAETCPLMIGIGESCTLYPIELEKFIGEPFLCRVELKESNTVGNMPSLKIKNICTERGVIDRFIDEYMMDVSSNAESSTTAISKELSVLGNNYYSSCESMVSEKEVSKPICNDMFIDSEITQGKGCDLLVESSNTKSPGSVKSVLKRPRLTNHLQSGTTVETVICYKRIRGIKKKLNFGEGEEGCMENK